MINIHLIVLGKLKESYWKEAEAEYLKRLKPYARLTIHELKEESFDDKSNTELIKEKAMEKIKDRLSKIKNGFSIALDEHGKQLSSPEFVNTFNNNETMEQRNNLTFIIGGPLGLHASILKSANLVLSLSKMTFTHQMARVFLLEQIYRAMMIKEGRKCHS